MRVCVREQALDKGRFSKTDHYVDHVITDAKAILLVTDRRVVLMSLDLFGQWQVRFPLRVFIVLLRLGPCNCYYTGVELEN